MAQQAARRIKRTGGAFLLRGLLWSIGATVAAVAVFAVIIVIPNMFLLWIMRKYVSADTMAKGFKMG